MLIEAPSDAHSAARTTTQLHPKAAAGATYAEPTAARDSAGACYPADGQEVRYYLAVDCGGTKAAAAITSSHPTPGTSLAVGYGGPANFTDISTEFFLRNVRSAIENACFKAGLITLDQIPDRLRPRPAYRHPYAASPATSTSNLLFSSSSSSNALNAVDQDRNRTLEPDAFSIDTLVHRRRSAVLLHTLGTPEGEAEEIPLPPFQAAWFAVAGVDSENDANMLKSHLTKMLRLHDDEQHGSDGVGMQFVRDHGHLPIGTVPTRPENTTARTRLIVANDTSLLAAPLHDSIPSSSSSSATPSSSTSAHTSPSEGEQTAVVVIAGTGSIVASFRRDDRGAVQPIGRAGGYGWLLGDEGSGFAVGREAIRRVLTRADREALSDKAQPSQPAQAQADSIPPLQVPQGQSSGVKRRRKRGHLLRDEILNYWHLSSTDELLAAVYSQEKPGATCESCRESQAGVSTRAASISSNDAELGDEGDERSTLQKRDTIKAKGSRASLRQEVSPQDREQAVHAGEMEADEAGNGKTARARLSRSDTFKVLPSSPTMTTQLETPRNTVHNFSANPDDLQLARPLSSTIEDASPLVLSGSEGKEEEDSALSSLAAHPTPLSASWTSDTIQRSKHASEVDNVASASTIPATTNGFVHAMGERKHRLAGLATLVFSLAFDQDDRECLSILRSQAGLLARHILEVVDCGRRGLGEDGDSGDDDESEEEEEGIHAQAGLPNRSQDHASRTTRASSGLVDPSRSVLCTGGSLLGIEPYRLMVEEECRKLGGVTFKRSVYVGKPAYTGAQALAQMWERDRS
ncbi:hypothetical protein CF327_g544 [Tilletia walkeri]|uniref:N-acetylglucosamine kinase n=1 Tax=Tilletia walkeri TaxID=117179 RepID=A0A8X7NEJ8_9BASI|nr:hypothetical protein CF327_g544 [Tilletia walkeri]KAE8271613.1 hypothetical protein A4X09_0g711 [Tilletia walkeri]